MCPLARFFFVIFICSRTTTTKLREPIRYAFLILFLFVHSILTLLSLSYFFLFLSLSLLFQFILLRFSTWECFYPNNPFDIQSYSRIRVGFSPDFSDVVVIFFSLCSFLFHSSNTVMLLDLSCVCTRLRQDYVSLCLFYMGASASVSHCAIANIMCYAQQRIMLCQICIHVAYIFDVPLDNLYVYSIYLIFLFHYSISSPFLAIVWPRRENICI